MADIKINELISLTEFEPGDKANLILYLNDPVIYRNTLRIPSPYTEADADGWLSNARESKEKTGVVSNWAIRHRDHGLIGCIGCFLKTGLEGHLDEIGYWLAAPFRGHGITTNAVEALCNWMWQSRPSLVRIEAKVHANNPASARVLEKSGFEREGFARKLTIKNGELIDTILMAKIREEVNS